MRLVTSYTPVEGLTKEQGAAVLDELHTELEGILSYTYSYEEKTNTSDRESHWAELVAAGVTEDEVVQAEVAAVMDDLVERVAWHNCSQDSSVRSSAVQNGVHVEEIPVWGMDSYTRRNVELALEDLEGTMPEMQRNWWIERILAPAINRQGDSGYDLRLALTDLLSSAPSTLVLGASKAVLAAHDELGVDHFRVHPKGTGVVCRVKQGLDAQQFVTEYLGEVVPPWRWFEKQEAVEAAQKHYGKKPTLPDFYNMLLERHRDDSRGYNVLYIDASECSNFASSLSHSCDPNCRTTVAAIGNRYSVCLYTVRKIEYGEELTIDYSAATEQEKEFRAAVCLCGSCSCRGSFLYFTGLNESQQVMNTYHTLVDRFAQMVLACSSNSLLINVQGIMNRHGLRSICVGQMPEWLHKFVALALKFVDMERATLPLHLLNSTIRNVPPYTYLSADSESRQMLEQRVQNLAISISRVRMFLTNQLKILSDPHSGYERQIPPIQPERAEEASGSSRAGTNSDANKPWTTNELQRLASLVAQHGAGNWATKAVALGTGRSAASTGSAWRRYENQRKQGGPALFVPAVATKHAPVVTDESAPDSRVDSGICTDLVEHPCADDDTFTFHQPGPMGLVWSEFRKDGLCAARMVVREIRDSTPAALFKPQLKPGLVLKHLSGCPNLLELDFTSAMSAMKMAARPTTLTFFAESVSMSTEPPPAFRQLMNLGAQSSCPRSEYNATKTAEGTSKEPGHEAISDDSFCSSVIANDTRNSAVPHVHTSSTATATVKIDHSSAGLLAKRGVGYTAEEDETAKSIAQKLGVDVVDLVALNKQRYPALTRTRRLLHGTVLLIPDTPGASDGNRVIGQKRVRLTQLGVLVNLLGQ